MGGHPHHFFIILVLISLSQSCKSWNLFSSSSDQTPPNENPTKYNHIEFSMEGFNNQKGIELIEKMERKMVASNSCFQNAYQSLSAGCSKVMAEEEMMSRFAWLLSNCFLEESGRTPLPSCHTKSTMLKCRRKLDAEQHMVFLDFYLNTNSLCYQLQMAEFKRDTERMVNELKNSAQFAEEKLEIIQARSESLLQSSTHIQDALASIDDGTQQVARASKTVGDHLDIILKHSEGVYEQAKDIAASQSEMREGQAKMKEKMEEGMSMLQDSYNNLGQEIDHLRIEATEIEKEISKVGDKMSLRMDELQSSADDIGNMAGISLEKQKELLGGQNKAIEGLQFLTTFQFQALEESRGTLKNLAEFSHRQQEELLRRQEQLQQVHDHLVESSESILAAQEAFESKQANMFIALEKLYALHNAMLHESRLIKLFFIYSLSIFILYMFTSTKQTYAVRPTLYTGLCMTFLIEFVIIRFAMNEIEQQRWIISLIRLLFVLFASVQLLHAIFTYRDYETLNHRMLLTLVEKVNSMQRNKDLSCDSDSNISWSSWIDTELPEEVNSLEDPDYMLPEEVGENSIMTSYTRRYDLRHRHHC